MWTVAGSGIVMKVEFTGRCREDTRGFEAGCDLLAKV